MVEINSIGGVKAAPAVEAPAAEAPEAEAAETEKPALKSMKKAELIEFAKANNIEVDEKALKADILETIEAAL